MLRNTAAVFGQTVHAAEYFFGSAATPRDGEDGATNAPQETDMDTS